MLEPEQMQPAAAMAPCSCRRMDCPWCWLEVPHGDILAALKEVQACQELHGAGAMPLGGVKAMQQALEMAEDDVRSSGGMHDDHRSGVQTQPRSSQRNHAVAWEGNAPSAAVSGTGRGSCWSWPQPTPTTPVVRGRGWQRTSQSATAAMVDTTPPVGHTAANLCGPSASSNGRGGLGAATTKLRGRRWRRGAFYQLPADAANARYHCATLDGN